MGIKELAILGANYLLYLVPPIVLVVFWRVSNEQRKTLLLKGMIVLITAVLLAKIGGMVYYDPRPFVVNHVQPLIPHADDNGFPSDHTLTISSVALLLAPFSLPAGVITLLVAIMVGLSRMVCQLHSMVDIIASMLFALIANGLAWYLVRAHRPSLPSLEDS